MTADLPDNVALPPLVAHWLGVADKPSPAASSFHLARFLILRLLGLIYLVGFSIILLQGLPLLGERGLLPITDFTERVVAELGSRAEAFQRLPSFFWFGANDTLLLAGAWYGLILSFAVLCGATNAALMAMLWALYMSYVHVGQDWYGYGWEIQLLETGFLAIFLCPLTSVRPFPSHRPPPVVIALFRWLIFRIMVGAGLIKLRGDPCWRDLTCLRYHYETQPIPNPFSRVLHFAPPWMATAGTLFNHVTELVAPWLLLLGRRATCAAGMVFVAFQLILVASGNLSFLNWLTIVPALACFDDEFLGWWMPRAFVRRAREAEEAAAVDVSYRSPALRTVGALPAALVAAVVVALSVPVVRNLVSGRQIMNTSFNSLDLVNTYGAFGSVGRERRAIVFEGTRLDPNSPTTEWQEYDLHCASTDPGRRPCVISPYHYRLDWQIWFAAMGRPADYPWTLRLVWKLLHNDPLALSLLPHNPFPTGPPRYIRARLYEYRFAPPESGRWWDRELVGDWIPPVSIADRQFLSFLNAHGWLPKGAASRLEASDDAAASP